MGILNSKYKVNRYFKMKNNRIECNIKISVYSL